MTNDEKATQVASMLLPEVVETSDLLPYVKLAEEIVLGKRFPFQNIQIVPARYENIQCQIAVELWNKRGAEGEITHNENGINRTWESLVSSRLLSMIVPKCGSVTE